MAFVEGKSGNPAGRPKGSGRNALCKAYAEKYGIPFLISVARGKLKKFDEKTRVEAAKYLIDQGLGKAPQAVEHSGGDRPVVFTLETGDDVEPNAEASG